FFRHPPLVAGLEPMCRPTTPRGCPIFRAIIGPFNQTGIASAGGWLARARVGGGEQRGAGSTVCRAGSSAPTHASHSANVTVNFPTANDLAIVTYARASRDHSLASPS